MHQESITRSQQNKQGSSKWHQERGGRRLGAVRERPPALLRVGRVAVAGLGSRRLLRSPLRAPLALQAPHLPREFGMRIELGLSLP